MLHAALSSLAYFDSFVTSDSLTYINDIMVESVPHGARLSGKFPSVLALSKDKS